MHNSLLIFSSESIGSEADSLHQNEFEATHTLDDQGQIYAYEDFINRTCQVVTVVTPTYRHLNALERTTALERIPSTLGIICYLYLCSVI